MNKIRVPQKGWHSGGKGRGRFCIVAGIFVLALSALSMGQESLLPPLERVESPTSSVARWEQIKKETNALRESSDSAGLERLAEELRVSKARLDGGTWLLSRFYDTLTWLPDDPPEAALRIEFFENWAREKPESITANVALADAMTNYAWTARGSGWASSVTDEQWEVFNQRIEKAREILESAARLPEKCPHAPVVMQTVSLAQSWDAADNMQLVEESLVLDPPYGAALSSLFGWMQPRWHGEEGDYQRFLAERADRQAPGDRDRYYAFGVWMANVSAYRSLVRFGPEDFSWERTSQGFQDWLAGDPDNLGVRFQYLQMALVAGDRETAKAQFDITGGKYYPSMWSDEAQFEAARAFAYFDGPNPLEQPAKTKSRRTVPTEAFAMIATGLDFFGRFLGGLLAGLGLLVLCLQRRAPVVGLLAGFSAVVLATFLGTISTLLPAVVLWLVFRRRSAIFPPPLKAANPWLGLLAVVVVVGLYLGLQVGAALLLGVSAYFRHPYEDPGVWEEVINESGLFPTITFNAGWIAILGLMLFAGPANPAARLGWRRIPWLPAAYWSVGAALLAVFLGWASQWIPDERTMEAVRALLEGVTNPAALVILIVVMAPILEELLFRGYVYEAWAGRIGLPLTVLVTALLFMGCHFHYGPAGLITTFGLGVVLGMLRWKTGSVIPCVAVHAAYNLVAVVFLVPEYLNAR